MGKTKTFGPSNDDIPDVDMHLAMIVQNAKAHGLKWTKYALYRSAGNHVPVDNPTKAAYCCAIGAAQLENDTKDIAISAGPNDNGVCTVEELRDSVALGLGFRLAMR